jgi:hypothetical protein
MIGKHKERERERERERKIGKKAKGVIRETERVWGLKNRESLGIKLKTEREFGN